MQLLRNRKGRVRSFSNCWCPSHIQQGFRTNLRPPNPLYCIISSLSPTVACQFSFSQFKSEFAGTSIFCWRCCFYWKPIFGYPYCDGSRYFGVEYQTHNRRCEIIGQFIFGKNRFANTEHFQGQMVEVPRLLPLDAYRTHCRPPEKMVSNLGKCKSLKHM